MRRNTIEVLNHLVAIHPSRTLHNTIDIADKSARDFNLERIYLHLKDYTYILVALQESGFDTKYGITIGGRLVIPVTPQYL